MAGAMLLNGILFTVHWHFSWLIFSPFVKCPPATPSFVPLFSALSSLMGFPCAAIANVVRLMSIATSLMEMLHHLKSMAVKALLVPHYISFPREPHEPEQEQIESSHDILVMDGLSPSLVPVPTHILTSLIKNRSPVLQYGLYLERNGGGIDRRECKSRNMCAVCLGRISKRDEIRELCNCSHVFHRECLDRWVDEKKVTCPLCRAALYPADWDWRSCRGDSSKTAGVAYSLGDGEDWWWTCDFAQLTHRGPQSCLIPDYQNYLYCCLVQGFNKMCVISNFLHSETAVYPFPFSLLVNSRKLRDELIQ